MSDVVDEMDVMSGFTAYLNPRTGEFVSVPEDADALGLEEEDEEKIREIADSNEFLALPSSFDIHEWGIMQSYAESLSDEGVSISLRQAIHGRGAFRIFNDQLRSHGLTEDWLSFRRAAFVKIAIAWLEENGIPHDAAAGTREP